MLDYELFHLIAAEIFNINWCALIATTTTTTTTMILVIFSSTNSLKTHQQSWSAGAAREASHTGLLRLWLLLCALLILIITTYCPKEFHLTTAPQVGTNTKHITLTRKCSHSFALTSQAFRPCLLYSTWRVDLLRAAAFLSVSLCAAYIYGDFFMLIRTINNICQHAVWTLLSCSFLFWVWSLGRKILNG